MSVSLTLCGLLTLSHCKNSEKHPTVLLQSHNLFSFTLTQQAPLSGSPEPTSTNLYYKGYQACPGKSISGWGGACVVETDRDALQSPTAHAETGLALKESHSPILYVSLAYVNWTC